MSRFLPLLIFILWKSWDPDHSLDWSIDPLTGLFCFFGAYLLLILGMGIWSRRLARRLNDDNLRRGIRRFNRMMEFARIAVAGWFGVGVYSLGWAPLVHRALRATDWLNLDLPMVCVGTLPAFLAWMGLWWSQYPADRALREQSLLVQIDLDMPVHAPPTFWTYFGVNLRLQILFIAAPVLLVLLTRDLLTLFVRQVLRLRGYDDIVETAISLPSVALVMLLSPEILRRIIPTAPLPPDALRQMLEGICRRYSLRYRDILLWQTHGNVANALVMGLIPRVRYILLSDLLLETMTDEQIEAVFAHEVGHVRHRHMLWYVVFFVAFMLATLGPAQSLQILLTRAGVPDGTPLLLTLLAAGVGAFLLIFGYVMRKYERQADVFAARTLQGRYLATRSTAPVSAMAISVGGNGGGPSTRIGYVPGDVPFDGRRAAGERASDDRVSEFASPSVAGAMPAPLVQALAASLIDGAGISQQVNPASHRAAAEASAPALDRAHATYVGSYGAAVFNSALRQVAHINCIPIAAPSWCHGSIASRISFLDKLSADPARTVRFDRFMSWLNAMILVGLGIAGAWTIFVLVRG